MVPNFTGEPRLQVGMAQVFGALAACLGLMPLVGWYAEIPLLTSFAPGWIPMAPSTALLFVFMGTATFLRAVWPTRRSAWRAGLALAGFSAVASVVLLVLSSLGIRWRAEYLGISITGEVAGAPVGHISPVTALSFALGGLSLLASHAVSTDRPRRAEVGLWSAMLVVLISFVLALGYFAGTPLLYGGGFIPPALPTSLAFMCLGAGLMALAGLLSSRAMQVLEAVPSRAGTTLLLTYFVLAVGMATAGYLYARQHERQFRSQVEQELAAIVGLKVQEIARWRAERLRDGAQFHDNQAFSDVVARALGDSQDKAAGSALLEWMGRLLVESEYYRAALIDPQGQVRFFLPVTVDPSDSLHPDELAEAIRSHKVTFLDLHRDALAQPIHMQMLIPVSGIGESTELLGVLILRIDPAKTFYPLVSRWPTPNQTAEVLLLRRDGQDALVLNPLRLDRLAALTRRVPLDRNEVPAVQAVLGQTGFVEGVSYDGIEVLAEVRSVPDSPWFIEARMSADEVLAPLQARQRNLAALVVALMLGAGAGTGWIWRQQQLRHYRERSEIQRKGEARYRQALEAMLEGAQIIGFDWRYLYLNDAAARYGRRSREELLGRTVMAMYPGIEGTPMFADMRRCMQERTPHQAEYHFQYSDGSRAWFEFSIQPVPEGIFILSLDVTARKEREQAIRQLNVELERRVAERTEQLEAANQELEAFSYSVSHDLRAPLRAIDGFSRILLDDHAAELDAEAGRLLAVIRSSTEQMDRLISDLLNLSRVSRSDLRRSPVDLADQVRAVYAEVIGPEVRATFEFSVASLPPAEVDPSLLRQVWSNLLSNAVKYSMSSAVRRIEVGGSQEPERKVYFVRDHGVGFDPEYTHKLFGVFQRLHSVQEFEGTGVGLAIVKRIVHRHGGEVWAEGKPGEGATFYFSLPAGD